MEEALGQTYEASEPQPYQPASTRLFSMQEGTAREVSCPVVAAQLTV